MQKETKYAIARGMAKQIIKDRTIDVDSLEISERLADELPGLDQGVFEEVAELVDAFLQVAEIETYFQEYRIKDDGTVMSKAEVEQNMKAEVMPGW
jgi:hypothetical protein